jgi:tetratricopeptide (TPR) repeat protein
VSPRRRAVAVTAFVAALSTGVVVAIAASSGGEPPPQRQAAARPGTPPLALDLGVRTDAEARDLRRAQALYTAGKLARARALFARHDSLEARVGRELAAWPHGTLAGLSRLAALYPKSALVQLELGLASFWAGQPGADTAWRQAAVLEPNTAYAVTAGNLLYPGYARGLPTFVPDQLGLLDRIRGTSPPGQLAELRRWAAHGVDGNAVVGHLLYGVALQRLGRPLSAQQQFDRAAALAPNDPEALTAAAVGRFDKADPGAAFSRLGPLSRRFPASATVRFHLGLLLLWIGSVDQAKRELRLATTADPGSPLAVEANQYLATLRRVGR